MEELCLICRNDFIQSHGIGYKLECETVLSQSDKSVADSWHSKGKTVCCFNPILDGGP